MGCYEGCLGVTVERPVGNNHESPGRVAKPGVLNRGSKTCEFHVTCACGHGIGI